MGVGSGSNLFRILSFLFLSLLYSTNPITTTVLVSIRIDSLIHSLAIPIHKHDRITTGKWMCECKVSGSGDPRRVNAGKRRSCIQVNVITFSSS